MAISVVQTSSKLSSTSTNIHTIALNNVVARNHVFVVVLGYVSAGFFHHEMTVSDSDGRYACDVGMTDPSRLGWAGIYRMSAASSGSHSISISTVSTTRVTAVAFEVASTRTRGGLLLCDRTRFGRGSSTAPTTNTTPTTSLPNELLVSGMVCLATQASIAVSTSPTNWSQLIEELDFSTNIAGEANQCIVSTAGNASASWTLASSASWAAVVATYAETVQ
jgi:hypothetical protein